jgi:hypothetical protein
MYMQLVLASLGIWDSWETHRSHALVVVLVADRR